MHVKRTTGLVLVALLLGGPSLAEEQDWPHFRGPDYDGNPVTKPFQASSVKKVWEASVHTGMASMSIVQGRLYTMGNKDDQDFVWCLNSADGGVVWTHDYPCKLAPNQYEGGPSATPTVHGGKVYTISKSGHIFCLDAGSGKKIWEASASRFDPPPKLWWGYAGSPTVVGDVVCFNVGKSGLGLNKNTGEIVWSSEPGGVAYATVIPLPDSMLKRPAIAVLTCDTLHILDPATGQSAAEFEKPWSRSGENNGVSPVVCDGDLLVTHARAGMSRLVLAGNTLKQKWEQRDAAMNWFTFNQRVVHQGHVYFLKRPGGLRCVDAEDGQLKWTDETFRFGNLLLVGDTLFILDETGELIWGPLKDGRFKEAHRAKILEGRCWAYPVIHDGRIYARNAQGSLVCFKFE